MIDFHNHLIPGVDDGAVDGAQARAALLEMAGQGVSALVATPHLSGAASLSPELLERELARVDRGWAELVEIAAQAGGVQVHRGAEVMLDTPAPELGDPRVRLAGTPFVLVEFPFMAVPPNAAGALYGLRMRGWLPVVAHPERYDNLRPDLADVEEWVRVGAALQVNAGSLLGRYGDRPRRRAWDLLERGLASYVCSDFHAREGCSLAAARDQLESAGGREQGRLLLEANAARLLQGEPPLPVPPLPRSRSRWRRMLGF